jgi:hypothetical protein
MLLAGVVIAVIERFVVSMGREREGKRRVNYSMMRRRRGGVAEPELLSLAHPEKELFFQKMWGKSHKAS